MKIVELVGSNIAVVESDGVRTRISTALLNNPSIGEYVIIHAGFAIERLDEKEANIRIDLYKELAALEMDEWQSGKVNSGKSK